MIERIVYWSTPKLSFSKRPSPYVITIICICMPNILYHKRSLTPFSLFWRTSLQNAFWQQRKKENLILCDRNIKYCIWKPKDMSFGNYLKYYQYDNISNTLFDIWWAMTIITIKRICIFMAPLEIYLCWQTKGNFALFSS